jgi:predicted Rossmann fold flavoprotein
MREVTMPPQPVDVLILGGGAAGLMCALTAGQRGLAVLVLESAERVGKKILISGGGRCNFTNLHAGPDNYLSGQPDFCRSALARYAPEDFIALVEKHGIAYHEKKLGQLFCDGSSRQIVEMLCAECAAAGVRIETGFGARHAIRAADGTFSVARAGSGGQEDARTGRALVIATGGLSFPQLGGSDFAYRQAEAFHLRLVPPRPGLVPLTCAGAELRFCAALSGVSVPCVARAPADGGRPFRENLLFTHRGLSGPAVLQASSYLPGTGRGEAAAAVSFDLLPDDPDFESWLSAERKRGREIHLANLLAERLPARVAQAFCEPFGPSRPLRQHSPKMLAELARQLRRWIVRPSGTEGYAKAEVTLGGIDTRELHGKTMEARRYPGLYCIGEAVDVTGQLGGFNFQWAWASGFAAGSAIARPSAGRVAAPS